ncbi:MAG: hypothetical protein ACRC7G_08370, partial [Beijerinckiaceae bacterium]
MSILKTIAVAALAASVALPALAQQTRRTVPDDRKAQIVTGSTYGGPFNDRTQYLSQHTRNASQV